MEHPCEICGLPGLKSCPSCKTVYYCSSDHKRIHRKSHKKICSPIIIQDYVSTCGTTKGKTWTASRDLDMGTIICEETPFFVSPYISDAKDDAVDFMCCVICGIDICSIRRMKPKKICSKCFWPICGVKCEMHTIHADNECPVFVSQKIKFSSFSSCNEAFKFLTMTRAHCKKMNEPKIWKQLVENQSSIPNQEQEQEGPVPPIHPGSKVPPNGRLKEDQMNYRKIRQLMKTKGFTLQQQLDPDIVNMMKSQSPLLRRGHYIYQRASHLRHACAPNVNWSIGDFPDFKIRMWAALPIKKGEALTCSRFNVSKDRPGVETTKEIFAKTMGHACNCQRCSDPTEFSTYMSALACSTCHKKWRRQEKKKIIVDDDEVTMNNGYFLPVNPLQLPNDPDAVWKCNSCDLITTWSSFEPTIENIRSHLFSISELVDHGDFSFDKAEGRIKNLMSQQRKTFLHPNHWLLQQATYYLMLGQMHRLCLSRPTKRIMRFNHGGDENELVVQDLLKYAQYLLTLQKKASPGLSGDTAALLTSTSFGLKKKVGSMIWDFRQPRTLALVTSVLDLLKLRTTLEERALDFYKMELADRGRKYRHMVINCQNELRSLAKMTETFGMDQDPDQHSASTSLLFGVFLFGVLTIIFFV